MSKRKGVFFYADFDLSALLHLAGELRDTPCYCDQFRRPESGSWNWTIFLLFKDGVEWAFLSPRTDCGLSLETIAKVLKSQIATMKYVKSNTSIPVPEVFGHDLTGSNTIGVPFILMSKAPGFPLSRFAWDSRPEGLISSRKPRPYLKREDKEKIITQLGTIVSQLLDLRFDKIGSLFEEDGEYYIKECLSPALIWHERVSLGADVVRGPFLHEHEYYESLVSALLLHATELDLGHHVFFAPIPRLKEFGTFPAYRSAVDRWNDFVTVGAKIDNSENRLAYCAVGKYLREMIPAIVREFSAIDGFPIKHPDLSPSNVFVDSDLNITCIIDWAFSTTVPISTLLITPNFPHPRDEIDDTLVPTFRASLTRQFRHGNLQLNTEVWESTRLSWLFSRLVTLDGLQDYYYFTELYALVYKPQDEINIRRLFKSIYKEREFVELAGTLSEDDRPVDEIKRDEENYFRFLDSRRETVAKKLTVIAELSEGFVADMRLWRWIEDAMVYPEE